MDDAVLRRGRVARYDVWSSPQLTPDFGECSASSSWQREQKKYIFRKKRFALFAWTLRHVPVGGHVHVGGHGLAR
jgi:hypothetical protein